MWGYTRKMNRTHEDIGTRAPELRRGGIKQALLGEPFSRNTSEIVWRLLWIAAIGIALSYASYLFFGSILRVEAEGEETRIVGIDVVKPGEHHLSGVVLVPSSCYELSVDAHQMSPTSYELAFKTWQEPSRNCSPQAATKLFQTVVFAPSVGVGFHATLDGEPRSLELVSHYERQSP